MKNRSEGGFSYIDVMIAIVILTVGILALMAAIAGSVLLSKGQETQLSAKQIATSTMESIRSAKETSDASRLGWPSIGNVGSNVDTLGIARGIFQVGPQAVKSDAGPDEVVGTADDTGTTSNFRREIIITDICDPDRPSYNCATPGTAPVRIRSIRVKIYYFVGNLQRQEVLNNVLTDIAPN